MASSTSQTQSYHTTGNTLFLHVINGTQLNLQATNKSVYFQHSALAATCVRLAPRLFCKIESLSNPPLPLLPWSRSVGRRGNYPLLEGRTVVALLHPTSIGIEEFVVHLRVCSPRGVKGGGVLVHQMSVFGASRSAKVFHLHHLLMRILMAVVYI